MRIDNEAEQLSIYDLDLWCGKMFQEPSPAEPQKERISGSSSRRSSELKSVVFQSLDLRTESGRKQDLSSEMDGALHGELSTLNFGESPSVAVESRLSWILEDNVPERYYLSARACQGILNRASRRGKELPEILRMALLTMIEWWKERDAALKQLSDICDCDTCKHTGCIPRGGNGKCVWEWNGGTGEHP